MKGLIYSNQQTLFGKPEIIGYGSEEFKILEINRDIANELIVKNHYSKKFYNATYIHLGVMYKDAIKGVLQYGYAMNPASQSSVVKKTEIDEYLELNRMWLCDSLGKNSESMAISYSFKYIKNKYKKIKWVQSFADERCGLFGIVYQSANFLYFGEHDSVFWELDNEIYHNSLMTRNPNLSKSAKFLQENKSRAISYKLRQFRYIYFFDKKYIHNCNLHQKEYPKFYKQ